MLDEQLSINPIWSVDPLLGCGNVEHCTNYLFSQSNISKIEKFTPIHVENLKVLVTKSK